MKKLVLYILYAHSVIPLISASLIFFIAAPSLNLFFFLFFVLVFAYIAFGIAHDICNAKEMYQLIHFIDEINDKEIKVLERKFPPILNAEQKELLFHKWVTLEESGFKLYQLVPPNGVEVGQIKGFTISYLPDKNNKNLNPSKFFSSRNDPVMKSCIFIRFDPDDFTVTQKFLFFHELGHLSFIVQGFAHVIPNHNFIKFFLFLTLVIFVFRFDHWAQVLFLSPLCLLVVGQPPPKVREKDEEMHCDLLAVEFFRKDANLKNELPRVKRALKLLLPDERVSNINRYERLLKKNANKVKEEYTDANILRWVYGRYQKVVPLISIIGIIICAPKIRLVNELVLVFCLILILIIRKRLTNKLETIYQLCDEQINKMNFISANKSHF